MTTVLQVRGAGAARAGVLGRVWHTLYSSGLLVPLAFLALMARFAPLADIREFDTDEGVNLIKALLVGRGYSLYTEVWDDQPPLLTAALAHWFNWFGSSVLAARILVLLCGALLLWAFYQAVRRTVTEPAALAGVALLLLSAYFARLSISVMIGLPALALAMLAVYLFVVAQQDGRTWALVLSAAVLALAMQVKLFAGLVGPAFVLCMALPSAVPGRGASPSLAARMRAIGLWLAVVLVTFVAVGLVFRSLDFGQLIAPHLGNQTRTAFSLADNLVILEQTFLRHVAYLPLAVAGIAWAITGRKSAALLPGIWGAVGLAFLFTESAVKYHHVLLLTIPLAWLCAYGVEASIWAFRQLGRAGGPRAAGRLGQAALVITAAALLFMAVYDPYAGRVRLQNEVFGGIDFNQRVVDLLCPGEAASDNTTVLTDRPYYAFLSNRAVPPPAAVLTGKRLVSGALTEDGLLEIIRSYQPRYVVLERFLPAYSAEFLSEVGKRYEVAQTYRWGPEDQPGEMLVARPIDGQGSSSTATLAGWLSLRWSASSFPASIKPGSCLDVQGLRWSRAETHSGQDLAVSLRLAGDDGRVLVQQDEQLGSDRNTLRDGPQITTFHSVFVPEGTPPGRYRLSLVTYDPRTGASLPAFSGGSGPQSGLVLGDVQIDGTAAGQPASRRAVADFGPVRLIEASAPQSTSRPGEVIPVSLLWQASPNFEPEPLVAVTQLIDEKGRVVANLEEEPLAGSYPTTRWQSGELVRDRHNLVVPPNTPPGTYNLIVGLYRAANRERLVSSSLLGLSSRDYFPVQKVRIP